VLFLGKANQFIKVFKLSQGLENICGEYLLASIKKLFTLIRGMPNKKKNSFGKKVKYVDFLFYEI
jgi:hypothetical protein